MNTYEKKYKEALETARKINSGEGVAAPPGWTTCEVIFPELKESEGERIRKELIEFVKSRLAGFPQCEKFIAWLEKQGGKKPFTIDIDKMVEKYAMTRQGDFGMPVNCQVKAYRQGINDVLRLALNLEKQGEQKLTVPKWRYKNDNTPLLRDSLILNKYGCVGKSPSGALVNDVWVMDYGELAKLPKEGIEKQGEQSTTDKVEPKFKVGDVITPKDKGHEPWQITQVDISGKKYRFKDDYVIPFSQEDNYELVEQKPTNRIKPKFKVGDWIVSNLKKDIFLIKSTNCGYFTFEDTKGNIYSPCLSPTEDDYHLWTIQDAKNGDVLVCPKYAGDIIPNIFIFKNIERKDNDVFCHCSFLEKFRTEGYVANADPINTDFYPATKEQRDTLIKAMTDAGYTFDLEKKELKEIEQKHVEWSEEDEDYINDLIKHFSQNERLKNTKEDIVIWLKSLRPQKQWKKSLATADLENSLWDIQDRFSDTSYEYRTLGEAIEFIRCTEPKPQWKPSDEQMNILFKYAEQNTKDGSILTSLYQDLKKLK